MLQMTVTLAPWFTTTSVGSTIPFFTNGTGGHLAENEKELIYLPSWWSWCSSTVAMEKNLIVKLGLMLRFEASSVMQRSIQVYTQSQRKRTMNSLPSPVTQGQGQVPPAGLYLTMRIWNRSQKTLFKNLKLFSQYLEKSKCMSYFEIRKTAQIPLHSMQIRYSLQTMHFFWPRVHDIESCSILQFWSVPSNVVKKGFASKHQMNWKSQPNFGDHVREKLPNISYFTVCLSWHALKHFKSVRKRWGILKWDLLYEMTRSIGKMIYQHSFAKLHSQKKEMQLSNFLRGWIYVILPVLKLLSIAREPWIILE